MTHATPAYLQIDPPVVSSPSWLIVVERPLWRARWLNPARRRDRAFLSGSPYRVRTLSRRRHHPACLGLMAVAVARAHLALEER